MLVCRRKMATKDTNIELYRNILSPTEIKFMGKIFINFLHELGHLSFTGQKKLFSKTFLSPNFFSG